jgi:hypothetical protein
MPLTKIQSLGITDGTIVNADINASAAIAGTKLSGAGKVLQVVSTTKLDTFSVAGTGIEAVTGLSLSITPSSASNKIFVTANFCGRQGDYGGGWLLYRSASSVATPTSIGSRTGIHSAEYDGQSQATSNFSLSYLDSPSSTSALTYQIYVNAVSNTIYHINRSSDNTDTADRPRTISTITAFEIAP